MPNTLNNIQSYKLQKSNDEVVSSKMLITGYTH